MRTPEVAPEPIPTAPRHAEPARPRLLIVDVDDAALESSRTVLGHHFELQCESNPYRALVALEDEGPFAAIVSSLTMSNGGDFAIDGIDVLEAAYRQAREAPRILVAAELGVDAAVEAVNRAHVTNIVRGPFDPDELNRTVIDALFQNDLIDDDPTQIDLR